MKMDITGFYIANKNIIHALLVIVVVFLLLQFVIFKEDLDGEVELPVAIEETEETQTIKICNIKVNNGK
jgi:hypothetical protein